MHAMIILNVKYVNTWTHPEAIKGATQNNCSLNYLLIMITLIILNVRYSLALVITVQKEVTTVYTSC